MILESLGLRSRSIHSSDQSSSVRSSSATATSSLTSSPGGRSQKRYSNNLFGSGRLRDYSYIRSVASNKTSTSRSASIAPSESSLNTRYVNGLRPVTPEGNGGSSSSHSSPEKLPHSAPLIPSAPYGGQTASEYRPSRPVGASTYKRASRALEDAIREIEEDVEDEILMPRSAPIARSHIDQHPVRLCIFSRVCSKLFDRTNPTPLLDFPVLMRLEWPSPQKARPRLKNGEYLLYHPRYFLAIYLECRDP